MPHSYCHSYEHGHGDLYRVRDVGLYLYRVKEINSRVGDFFAVIL